MWHKGTGGGPGLDIYFELWSQEKKNKYSINTSTYDHSNVAGRPAILIENYIRDDVKKPYLIVIHMLDEETSHLLSSKHDPFLNKKGEIGLSSSSEDVTESDINTPSDRTSTSSSTKNRARSLISTPDSAVKKRKKKIVVKKYPSSRVDDDGISGAIKAIINLSDPVTNEANNNKRAAVATIEDLSLNELFQQMDNHKNHLKFLQENQMCSNEEKEEIIKTIKDIYTLISKRTKTIC